MIEENLRSEEGAMLLVRKPKGWTSFDVVNRVRQTFGVRKIGHAGTLDPMATGLLILCTGAKTKRMSEFTGLDKEYEVGMILGARTPSHDVESEITERHTTEDLSVDDVRNVLDTFVGPQTQIPPMWSAAKVNGKRLYKYARKGREVERIPREIVVRSITSTHIEIPEVCFTIVCSKGTYVRKLVDDIGLRLGCGAYVNALRRTRIGEFRVEDALSIEELENLSISSPVGRA